MSELKPKANLTINDIAALAGVSKRTVSRVLNNSSSVNEQTRAKILSLFAEHKYTPSKQARGLASSRSYLIGLLYDEPNALVIHSFQKGLIEVFSPLGYELIVHPLSSQSKDLADDVMRLISRSNLDGVVIMPPISTQQHLLQALQKNAIPYTYMTAKSGGDKEHMVVSNDFDAMAQVAKLFAARGVKKPAIITGDANRVSAKERLDGLNEGLKKYHLSIAPHHIANADYSYDSGLIAARELLSQVERPDAIFASNDQMASAVLHVAEDFNIAVPDQLIVVGFDDEPMSARMRPTLTTLRRDDVAMARATAEKLLSIINQTDYQGQTMFEPLLIERQSTAVK